ncbi:hypothetical protein VDBG_07407 [Verticillium alfalfae VaMs.102]|uniref:Uncharacterized protein n=1 Tax=Verticillium alfalfae (strain VaMs.102 / ATCC MYA-4576 / FGSC 10136) TaxID=526221 RepID=C9SR22_VERA1|nr:hypothetical protein VDBG_07407 [Verticillium alfalfae VaMs.102]EEY21297.1 hypothetical protein VDBG_07407 [Verticillium alfalfae VaMs.102]
MALLKEAQDVSAGGYEGELWLHLKTVKILEHILAQGDDRWMSVTRSRARLMEQGTLRETLRR